MEGLLFNNDHFSFGVPGGWIRSPSRRLRLALRGVRFGDANRLYEGRKAGAAGGDIGRKESFRAGAVPIPN